MVSNQQVFCHAFIVNGKGKAAVNEVSSKRSCDQQGMLPPIVSCWYLGLQQHVLSYCLPDQVYKQLLVFHRSSWSSSIHSNGCWYSTVQVNDTVCQRSDCLAEVSWYIHLASRDHILKSYSPECEMNNLAWLCTHEYSQRHGSYSCILQSKLHR